MFAVVEYIQSLPLFELCLDTSVHASALLLNKLGNMQQHMSCQTSIEVIFDLGFLIWKQPTTIKKNIFFLEYVLVNIFTRFRATPSSKPHAIPVF